jgi:hypothetical protein
MEKNHKAVGRWVVWEDRLYQIQQATRLSSHVIEIVGRDEHGLDVTVQLSHMNVTYDLRPSVPKETVTPKDWISIINWIPVSVRLPDSRREVLTWHCKYGLGMHTYWFGDTYAWWSGHLDSYAVEKGVITHWAEKPSGPEEE